MIGQDGAVDGEQGLGAWEADREGCEMALLRRQLRLKPDSSIVRGSLSLV